MPRPDEQRTPRPKTIKMPLLAFLVMMKDARASSSRTPRTSRHRRYRPAVSISADVTILTLLAQPPVVA